MEKFPAFCNEMYKVVNFGDDKSKEITDINTLIPSLNANKSKLNPFDHDIEEEKININNNSVVFRESEQVTNTIHKMTTMLFHWLEKAAVSDPKYTAVCLMENYHYFYSVFSKTESLRAIREHCSKAKRNYVKARRDYVKWCVRYECSALTDFWDDFENKTMNDIETVTVYISHQKVRNIVAEFLDSDKKNKEICCWNV